MLKVEDRHQVVLASAGSGKTFALSNRYLELLRLGAEPGAIVAATFTRKAAGEIFGRVLTRLAEAAESEEEALQLADALGDRSLTRADAAAMLRTVVGSIHRVGVSTIDALLNRMAMCARLELGLPASPRLVEAGGPVARQLRRRAIDAMLADDDPGVLVTLLRQLHHDESARRITDSLDELFLGLYEIYRQTDAAAWHALPTIEALEEEQLSDALAVLASAEAHVAEMKSWANAWSEDLSRAMARDWEGFLAKGIAAKVAAGQDTYGNSKKPLPDELIAAYKPLVHHARATLVKRIVAETEATYALLSRFEAHFARLCREHGVVMFGDLPWLLSGAVAPGSTPRSTPGSAPGGMALDDLYFRLDGRVRHMLLDEFQDTSPVQWRVLEPLAEEIRQAAEADRSFFCVGDVKQSIYGWRGGCPEVFDRVIERLHLDRERDVRTLARSYRSSPAVLDVVNRVFATISSAPPLAELQAHAAKWERGFAEHVSAFAGRAGYVELVASRPSLRSAPGMAGVGGEKVEQEAAHLGFVVERIAELAQRHPARTIGVLVRKNERVATLLRRLREAGVHASGEGGTPLDSDPAVDLLLSALQLADHPGHTAAALHVLHSPLAQVVGQDGMDEAVLDRVALRVRRMLLDEGYAAVLTRWALALRPVLGPRSAERLSRLIELADQHDPIRTLRVDEFVRYVRATSVDDAAPARVRVMTTHQAKGLQFDVVVIEQLEELIGQAHQQQLWRFHEDPTEPAARVVRAVSKDVLPVIGAYADWVGEAREQEVGTRVADDLSVFYVAMTRPRYALHMIVRPIARTRGGLSSVGLSNATPASVLRSQLVEGDATAEGVLFEHGDVDWDEAVGQVQHMKMGEAEALSVPGAIPGVVVKSGRSRWRTAVRPSEHEGERYDVVGLFDAGRRRARRYGSEVHRAFEAVEYLDAFDAERAPEAVRRALAIDAVREVFTRRGAHEELWRERAFSVSVDGELMQGVFDRVVIERDSGGQVQRATIYDFKTDRVDDASVDGVVAGYRPQLEAYRAALAALVGIDEGAIEAKLVFVGDGVVVGV